MRSIQVVACVSSFFLIFIVISIIFLEILKVYLILRQLKQPKSLAMFFKELVTYAILILCFKKMISIKNFFFFSYSGKTYILHVVSGSAHMLLPYLVFTLFLKSLVYLTSTHLLLL